MDIKKICFFSGVIARSGGTERVGTLIANELSRRGFEVSILSMWNHGKPFFYVDQKVKVSYLLNPKKEGKLYRTYLYPVLKLRRFLKKNNIDVLIDIDSLLSQYSIPAARGLKCKNISWEHFNYWNDKTSKKRIKTKKLIKKYADKLVVLTDEDKMEHINKMNFPYDKITRIYNPSPFKPNNLIYKFENKVFLTVGRLTDEKGYDMLLETWKLFEEKNKEWKLLIIGDGEKKDKLLKLKEQLKIKNVYFVGKVNNVENYYKNSSCYILSSRNEGFPMVILEAESFGLPIISFDCKTGPKEMISNNDNGYLVKEGDVKLLAKKMLDFANDKEKAYQMSKRSIEKIQELSIERIGNEWQYLIENI